MRAAQRKAQGIPDRPRWRVLRDTRPGHRHAEVYVVVQVTGEDWGPLVVRLRYRGTFDACAREAEALERAEVAMRKARGWPLGLEHGPEDRSAAKVDSARRSGSACKRTRAGRVSTRLRRTG